MKLPKHNDNGTVIKVNIPTQSEIRTIRLLICCGLLSMGLFLGWFLQPEHIGYSVIYWMLTFALIFKLLKMLHEWYHYWSVSVPIMPASNKIYTVDVLTTACPGEPREMIVKTLLAMKAITYPHTNYLCDEGDDPFFREFCEREGIVHVTRIEKKDAKAGNINNALHSATGEICVVLDPDHEPIPEFLDRVLPYFENQEIGFVQCAQGYYNQDESIIARGAAEQTYHFYGPMMMCMNTYGTVQAIGANCTFRRKALDSIGGHAAGLSEDMHTAMQLHAKGWRSIYIPEMLSRGLVPATLSAYYKQQLKWSRGTFELLFRSYPSLFKKFTWRQKIHYFTIPLYFFYGLVNFIDILVPILALGLAQVPWEVDLQYFASLFIPLFGLNMLIRLYAQRWLLEKHERGFHFTGGMLRAGTWWIFLIGFIYTIFKIKVPYIPTPKEDEHRNYWRLSLPNFLMAILCLLFIVYGLSMDWTPYSFAMAIYAMVTVMMLGFMVLMSQQKFLESLDHKVKKVPLVNFCSQHFRTAASQLQSMVYSLFGNGPAVCIVAISIIFVSYNSSNIGTELHATAKLKEYGGFYKGLNLSEDAKELKPISAIKASNNGTLNIVSFVHKWDEKYNIFPSKLLQDICREGALPFINWMPVCKDSGGEEKICEAIVKGKYDNYLNTWAKGIRKYGEPLFVSFATEFDKAEHQWSLAGNNTAEDFIEAWQYVYTFFNNQGISNITWVWSPRHSNSARYFPGSQFVDWVGISCLNYGTNSRDKDWFALKDLYAPFRENYHGYQKPFIFTEFGSASGANQDSWLKQSLKDIGEKFKEVRGLIVYRGKKYIPVKNSEGAQEGVYIADFSFKTAEAYSAMALGLSKEPFSKQPFVVNKSAKKMAGGEVKHSRSVVGKPGNFSIVVDQKPFYIRGIAYNTAHDWRDGNMPLTRRRLEKDFESIRDMGANTIRRYGHGIYDKNILNIAGEYHLKVLYGFWFDPKIDYYKDTIAVNRYMSEVVQKVKEYKNHSSVLAWSLGNETWGLLKHRYAKPYLTKVRAHYVQMIELLARAIHEIDPNRPVFSCMEHEEYQLAGELVAFRDGAPSVDAIGVNSYYHEQIKHLNHLTYQFDSIRPYIVSEFGPRGYWDPKYNSTEKGSLKEETESEKAEWYQQQWTYYVWMFKGYNLGGFAYCWHDRMEGSYTWFGLTDYKARPKPTYYALKELWTKEKQKVLPEFRIETPASLMPGREYRFTAKASKSNNEALEYEWYLLKDEYLEKMGGINYSEDRKSIKVKIPQQASDYRLYLFVSDKFGNVTTASAPIKVK